MNSTSKFQQMFGYIIREYCEEREIESNIYRFRSHDNCRQKVEEKKKYLADMEVDSTNKPVDYIWRNEKITIQGK